MGDSQEATTAVVKLQDTSVEANVPETDDNTEKKAKDMISVVKTDLNQEAATVSEQGDSVIDVKESATNKEAEKEKAQSIISCLDILFQASSNIAEDPKLIAYRENTLAKNYSTGFPTPVIWEDLFSKRSYYSVVKKIEYNWAILAFGVENFLSYAAYFCKNEVQNDATEVISIGSGDGTVDNSIIEAYYNHFGSKLNITLVDKNPDFNVNFKTVDDLLEKRPNVVRNCVLFIIWPQPPGLNDNYDIEAIRKLQPTAVLTACELSEVSGSYDFVRFLEAGRNKDSEEYDEDDHNYRLDNYIVEEVARQEVYLRAGDKQIIFGREHVTEPGARSLSLRLVKVKRTD